jgi:molecular chaperone DnaK (HSP70)
MTLVIDFGTVNTVAMLDGRLVTVDGAPWLPSVVHSGVVGADAVLLGRGRETRNLKDPLEPSSVGAVFERMLSAARSQGGEIGEVVVTHPADWGPDRVGVLVTAAGERAHTLPEPLAVAAGQMGPVLVVDAGGGTWDVAVVRALEVVATRSLPVDLDQRIAERVQPSLTEPITDDATRAALLESCRVGKELLSRHDNAEIVLPDHRAVRLTRAEFELLIAPEIARLVALVGEVGSAGVEQVLLTGGCSRIPLLTECLTGMTGKPVTTDPEPETAVVRGACARWPMH